MSEQSISIFLKQLRKTSGLSANEVVSQLKKYGVEISSKTLYGYENDASMPNANVFVALCRIYKCDNPMNVFGSPSMSSSEVEHIKKYRSLDSYGQETVDTILEREITRVKELNQQRDRIKELENRPIIIEKHDDTMMRIYTYLRKIACAGNGFYFDDIPTETIEAPYLEGAEFIVGVNGDSMEPTYKDGDLVYVEKRQIIETGEIGIFIINNECFIKEAGEEGLISHNPKYPMIPGTENIQCIGKVLAKVPVLDN